MNIKKRIEDLYSSDNNTAYQALLELEAKAKETGDLLLHFPLFLSMITHNKSFIRVRGFRLICCLAKWDEKGLVNKNINTILTVLDDTNGTAVRQCLRSINEIMLYKNELLDIISEKLRTLDVSHHKESMQSLINRDISDLLAAR